MRIPARDLDKGVETAIRKLAYVGRADPDALVKFSPVPGAARSEHAKIAGEKLDGLQVHRTFFRYCPHCVAGDLASFDGPKHTRPWLRLAWTVGHYRSCDVHSCALIAAQPIRRHYEPFDFTETIDGIILPALADAINHATTMAPSPFQAWVTARLEGHRNKANWLDAVDLYAAAGFAEALGISMLHPPKVKLSELTDLDRAKTADAGFHIASTGPDVIRKVLADLTAAEAHRRGFWGLRDTFGHAYGLLQKTVKDPAYEPFRKIIRTFALETMPIEPGTDVLGVVAETRRVHTVRSAAMASGAHARTIRRYFERKGLVGDRATSGITDHRATVAADEIERIARELQGALSTPQVIAEFGIPRVHLTRLIELRHLPPVTDSADHAYGKHRFTHAAVQEMLGRLFDGAVDVAEPTGRQTNLPNARKMANCTLDEVFDLAFNGKLEWKGLHGGRREYGALLLDADELKQIVREKPKRQALSRAELKKYITGLAEKSPQFLIDRKLLVEAEEFSPDARRMIPVIPTESADDFKAKYVTLGELLKTHGLHHSQAIPMLDKAGAKTLYSKSEAGCFIYERVAAESAFKKLNRHRDSDTRTIQMNVKCNRPAEK